MTKVVLYLMSNKGLMVLKRSVNVAPQLIESVIVGQDANVKNDYSREIIEVCRNFGIKYFLRSEAPQIHPDHYIFAVSWRWMIQHPPRRLVVFHDSLLPRYRGFAPLVNMLINGEKEIGVTAIFGEKEYDVGDIIAQRRSPISYPIKVSEAISINNKNFELLVDQLLKTLAGGAELGGEKQRERDATYSIWRDHNDYKIDWSSSAIEIARFVDAVGFPYMGARTSTNRGEKLIVHDVQVVEELSCELRHVGKVIFVTDGLPTVICGKGLLKIVAASYADGRPDGFLPIASFRTKFI